jgi:hypothetical protein
MIGFRDYSKDEDKNVVSLFMIPIVFFITASILKDYFTAKAAEFQKSKKAEVEAQQASKDRQTMAAHGDNMRSTGIKVDEMEPKDQILFRYESIRFSIPFIIYQRIDQWRIMDTLALNFHLVTALVTVLLCTNWQISFFMFMQLACVVSMCLRVSYAMYSYGRTFKFDNKDKGLTNSTLRDNIDSKVIESEYITIDKSYEMNKAYKLQAS